MAAPATSGKLVTTLQGMNIGDYIVCGLTFVGSNSAPKLGMLGSCNYSEMSYSGMANPSNGAKSTQWSFYFVKVDKGLLIADRVIVNSISWDTLNSGKVIQGTPASNVFSDSTYAQQGISNPIIRSLTGGVAYADANGNYTTSGTNASPGWPTNNEYDRYLMNSTLGGKIIAGDDNVWHHGNGSFYMQTWCQDTPALAIAVSTNRVVRSNNPSQSWNFNYRASSTAITTTGFRPVFQYQE
ncbi:hypothetical protein [Alicyclobacillus shizuokensis]|uniref:hypothetical protein n=1 Tax=Alicyclobacillus shizuokensis TaxID=392014 RepID=UPI000A452A1A|nr:hypothetical protein [Alicyclobacillus shizuokensis]